MKSTIGRVDERWIAALFLMGIVLAFLVRGLGAVEGNTNSSAFDQRSFLNLGLNIRDGRDLTDGNRHPLLPFALSLFAQRAWAYYTWAKLLNLVIGATCLLLVYDLGRRWFNPFSGAVVAGLLSVSSPFLHLVSHVMAEPLLLALTLLSWYHMSRALAARKGSELFHAAFAGSLSGLAYLAKGTALNLVPPFLLVAVWSYRREWWWRKEVWLYASSWLLASSPLLLFNLRVYHNPFYNYNFVHEMFLDTQAQRHFAAASEAPTLQSYLGSHSLLEMVHRLVGGLGEVTRLLFRTLGYWPDDVLIGSLELAWIVLWAAAVAFLIFQRRRLNAHWGDARPALLLFLGMLIISLVLLGWYMEGSNIDSRFLMVFHPMIYLLAVGGLSTAFRAWLGDKDRAGVWRGILIWGDAVVMGGILLASCVSAVQALPHIEGRPFAEDVQANERGQAVLAWLEASTPHGTRVIWGPSYTLPSWIYERRLSLKDVPSRVRSWAEIESFAESEEASYAIVDWEMAQRRQQAFSAYFDFDYPYVVVKKYPPGWALSLPYDGFPSNWLVFRLLEVTPPKNRAWVTLGNSVRLVGYEVYPCPAQSGDPVYVTLYWRALKQMGVDYSAFVHLVGTSGSLAAQSDSWPLQGRLATSVWREGELFGDRHALLLPATLPSGSYRLGVGMYSLVTMQRLVAISEEGHRYPNDWIALDLPLLVESRPAPP